MSFSSDLALLWLWCRPLAAALIQLLAWELPYVAGVGLKKKKKDKNKTKNRTHKVTRWPQLHSAGKLKGSTLPSRSHSSNTGRNNGDSQGSGRSRPQVLSLDLPSLMHYFTRLGLRFRSVTATDPLLPPPPSESVIQVPSINRCFC